MQVAEVSSVRQAMDDMFKESLADWEARIKRAEDARDAAVDEARARASRAEEGERR
jgi:hypothetical protein